MKIRREITCPLELTHDIVKGKLKRIAQWLAHRTKADVKVFVDTAPLMEKPLAQKAGLGWQGRHTNLVSRELGSWFFIGTILTAAEIEPDPRSPRYVLTVYGIGYRLAAEPNGSN